MLKFSKANAKLKQLESIVELQPYLQDKRKVYSFDLLSGHSCPFAKDCFSKVVQIDGKKKIKDGPDTEFRCFSASQEVVFPAVYENRKANFDAMRSIKTEADMTFVLQNALPANLGILRIHVGGDFFNRNYFHAWREVAYNNPDRLFYAYTKSLNYWVECEWLPENFILTASRGGRLDHLIDEYSLRESVVVFSEEEAASKGLEIDHDDSHAARPDIAYDSFALLIHGQQPAGSEAGEAVKTLKKKGTKFTYGKNSKFSVTA